MSNSIHGSRSNILHILISSVIAVSISLVLILIFALLLRFVNIDTGFIMPINQVIKMVSIFIGCLVGFKSNKYNGFLKGLAVGVVYTVLAYLIFSLLSFSFNFNIAFIFDILCAMLIGGISGIIVVNA